MADTAEDLRTFLLADATILATVSTRCGQVRAMQDWAEPFLLFFRTGTDGDTERTLNQSVGTKPFREFFDLECVSDNLDEAADLAERIKTYADQFSGTFGGTTIQGMFVTDHDDDYQPRGISDDEAQFVNALRVELIGVA